MPTLVMFDEFIYDLGRGVHDFTTGGTTFNLLAGLVTSAAAPAATDATPRWGDYSANEVATGASYPAGGTALTGEVWQEDGTDTEMEANSYTIAQDASGFTNARYMILYNGDATNDEAIGFVDLLADKSIQSGDLVIQWSSVASGSPGRIFACSST